MIINQYDIEFNFNRLFSLITKSEIIKIEEIKSIEYYERKMSTLGIILNLI